MILCSICLSVSGLFYLAEWPSGSSVWLQMTRFPSFVRLFNIPLRVCTACPLSIHLPWGPWVVFIPWPLWTMLQWTRGAEVCSGSSFRFLWINTPGAPLSVLGGHLPSPLWLKRVEATRLAGSMAAKSLCREGDYPPPTNCWPVLGTGQER